MERVTSDKIPEMFEFLNQHQDVPESAKSGFLKSLASFYSKNGFLTQNQYIALERMKENYGSDSSEWRKNFDEEKKKIFKLCYDFYRLSKYYGGIISKVNKDPNYIPSEKEYRAFCENKYATILIREHNTPPKFNLGDMVRVRRNATMGVGNILEVHREVTAAVRGARTYKVYFTSSDTPFLMQERQLASVRDCDLEKMSKSQVDPEF